METFLNQFFINYKGSSFIPHTLDPRSTLMDTEMP